MPGPIESVSDVERWFKRKIHTVLWPVGLGSVSLRRSPCVRPGCYACETGEQHPAWVLAGTRKGRQHVVYLPDAVAPDVEAAVKNGRAVQELMFEAGLRYARALKREKSAKR